MLFSNSSTSNDITEWNWYFVNNNGYTSTQTNPSYMFEQSGNYPIALVVHNKYGCSDTIVKMITVVEEQNLYVPNSFTPNGDGHNDVFRVRGPNFAIYYFAVYNRWGELMYETTDPSQGWDGYYKGNPSDPGVFGYYVKAKCGEGSEEIFKKGNVTLIR